MANGTNAARRTVSNADDLLIGLNPEQAEVVGFHTGALVVGAIAGAGKTTALVRRMAYLHLKHGVQPERILAMTFSKKASEEMNNRLTRILGEKSGARVGTFHSLAMQFIREEMPAIARWDVDDRDDYKIAVKDAISGKGLRNSSGQLVVEGLRWESADLTLVTSFIAVCKAKCALPGSTEAMAYATELYTRVPAGNREPSLLCEAYVRAEQIRRARRFITFDDMLLEMWSALGANDLVRRRWASRWDFVMQDEAQDENRVQREIAEYLAEPHGNYMVVGDPGQCHPPGTVIDCGAESLPIEMLSTGMRVEGWNQNAQKMVGGRRIQVGSRQYDGQMVTIGVRSHDRETQATPNHRLVARWTSRDVATCVTYLMFRGDLGYRVGWCKLFATGGKGDIGFHLAQRARIEKADAVWILRSHEERGAASVHESIIAAKYGIPTATFEPVNGAGYQTTAAIREIFSSVGRAENLERGSRCLADHGRDAALPFYPWPGTKKDAPQGRRTIFQVHAANVMPGLMSVPLPDAPGLWARVSHTERHAYSGPVYSLKVAVDETYSADGIVVHNSIYGFRGSDPSGLINFQSEWDATKVLMERNYRCGTAIAEAANGSLRAMAPGTHLGMQIKAERTVLGAVECAQHEDSDAEADAVVQRIREANADGLRWKDIVVLFRTNAQSRAIEEAAIASRIPYQIIGGINFYERREVKDLLAYLRVAAGCGTFDDVRRCINAPFRFLGKQFVDRIAQAAGVDNSARGRDRRGSGVERRDGGSVDWTGVVRSVINGAGLQSRQQSSALEWCAVVDQMGKRVSDGRERANAYNARTVGDQLEASHAEELRDAQLGTSADEAMASSAPHLVIEDILTITDYIRFLTRDEGSESPENNRVSNVRELVRAARRFGTVDALLDYIDETVEAARRAKAGEEEGIDRVTMMSIHRSKGLEYRAVFLIGANEGFLPHARCEDPNEERRLFYVAITRAKDLLSVTCTRTSSNTGKVREIMPSRFIGEAGLSVEVPAPVQASLDVGAELASTSEVVS